MVKVQSGEPISAFQQFSLNKTRPAKKMKKKKIKHKKLQVDNDVVEIASTSTSNKRKDTESIAETKPNKIRKRKDKSLVLKVNGKRNKKKKKLKQNVDLPAKREGLNAIVESVMKKHLEANERERHEAKRQRIHPVVPVFRQVQDTSIASGEMSSIERGKNFFANLIAPVTVEDFMENYWERRPLLVQRKTPDYFSRLELTTGSLDTMLRHNNLRYTKNIDITSYKNGVRKTHNPEGRALPAEVWDSYMNNGYSVRLLNPQTYSTRLCALCAGLQEYFGCFVGANIYLTPPNTQGFAPHYDDIEAFVVQLEGRKHWRLYQSSRQEDTLPRFSSGNYKSAEIGEPFMEVTLEAGDVLYFPRGVIHQAVATDTHSLHVTVSCYQRNSWADLMEELLPAALKKAVSEDPVVRSGLPIGYLNHVGAVHAGGSTNERASFMETVHQMVDRVLAHVQTDNVDYAADRMGKKFMEDALPPVLTEAEKKVSVFEDGDRMLPGGRMGNLWQMDNDTLVRLTRAHCIRLVMHDGTPRLYHTMDNTKVYREEDPGFFVLLPVMVPCVEQLVRAYPNYIRVGSLPLGSLEEKAEFCGNLWMKGLLLTKDPIAVEEQL